MMKRLFIGLIFCAAVGASFLGCKETHTLYDGPSYVMFSDSLSTYPVQQSGDSFGVKISATRKSAYDRTFGIEVIAKNSNAIYGEHYTLENSTVTIKAGEYTTQVNLSAKYDNIEETDSLGVALRLVSLDDVEWDIYGVETKVLLQKVCPFNIEDFTGYCVLTSSFFTNSLGQITPRLTRSEVVPGEENTIVFKGFFYEGYDIKVRFDFSDPLSPKMKLTGEQVIADTREALGTIYGDGRLLADNIQGINSFFDTCNGEAVIYLRLRIDGTNQGGNYINLLEWITDKEAEDYM